MKNKTLASLAAACVVLAGAVPAGAMTITFDDLKEDSEFKTVTLTNAFATDQKLSISGFRLLEQANSDGAAGSISDEIVFAIDDRHPRDLTISFFSDSGEFAIKSKIPAYGTTEETGGFQTIPLPTDTPVPPDLIVKVRSDAPIVPDTANLAAEAVAVLIGFNCLRRGRAA